MNEKKSKTLVLIFELRQIIKKIFIFTYKEISNLRERKLNRMAGFDYSTDAVYFLTICCKNMIHHFGEIKSGEMFLNESGEIAKNQILWLQDQYRYVEIHNFIVMPNHVHILIEINRNKLNGILGYDYEGNGRDRSVLIPKIKSISELMGAFKTTSSKKIHLVGNSDFVWHKSFHDNIVRSPEAYYNIDKYISENPMKWNEDKLNF